MNTIEIIKKELGLSQYYLAVLLGVTITQLSMAEKGKKELPISAVKKLTEVCTKLGFPNVLVAKTSNTQIMMKPEKYFEKLRLESKIQSDMYLDISNKLEDIYNIISKRQQYLNDLFSNTNTSGKLILNILELESSFWLENCNPDLQKKFKQIGELLKQIQNIVEN